MPTSLVHILAFGSASHVVQFSLFHAVRYGAKLPTFTQNWRSQVKLTVPRTMRAPVYVYYYVGNFYQARQRPCPLPLHLGDS